MSEVKDRPAINWRATLIIAAVVIICCGILALSWAVFSQYGVRYSLETDLDKGIKTCKTDMKLGQSQIDDMFAQAIKDNTEPVILMELYRKYAYFLFDRGWTRKGDEQLQNAIEIGLKNDAWKKYQNVGGELSHAYSDRAWYSHCQWLKDETEDSGEKDQLQSIEVAEKVFGSKSPETICRKPFLAVIYADDDRDAEADKILKECLAAIGDNSLSKSSNWLTYAVLGRVRATQHRYDEAMDAYLEVKKVCTQENINKAWDDLLTGLRRNNSDKHVETQIAKDLFNNNDFAELDRIGAQYVTAGKTYWNGFQSLDYFSSAIEGTKRISGERYLAWVDKYEKWLKKNPKSDLARTCLAQLHLYRAWALEDDDDDDSIYKSLVEKAEKVMAVDPGLPNRFPKAYVPALRIAAAKHDRDLLEKLIKAEKKNWPKYFCAKTWAYNLQDKKHIEEKMNRRDYVTQCADSIGNFEGDKFYARMACEFASDYRDGTIDKEDRLDWQRVKAGLNQIVRDYPDELEARISYLTLADAEGDSEAVEHVFDKFTPTNSRRSRR